MMAKVIRGSLSLLFLAHISCVDDINLDASGNTSYVVIEGKITDQPGPYTVTIRQSARFLPGERDFPDPISDAEVHLKSSAGEDVIMLETEPGEYQTSPLDIFGRVGREYHIEVILNDGRTYQSRPEMLQLSPAIDSLGFSFEIENRLNEIDNIVPVSLVKLFVSTQIPNDPENAFFRWQVSGEYEFEEVIPLFMEVIPEVCYVMDTDIDNSLVIIASGDGIIGQPLLNFEIFQQRVDYKFAHRYGYRVDQESLTMEAFEYMEKIEISKNREGGLFEQPVGSIEGNILNVNDPNERVLGYFFASARSFSRLFIDDSDVGNPLSPCEFNLEEFFEAPCEMCTLLNNSTTVKPSYWP